MNKLEYVNNLLEKEDLTEYIQNIEKNSSVSPNKDLKEKILAKCYNSEIENLSKENKKQIYKFNLSFYDILKVACFTFVITLCTELFMNSSYASLDKENNVQTKNNITIYKITEKLDTAINKFSDFMLDNNLKGE